VFQVQREAKYSIIAHSQEAVKNCTPLKVMTDFEAVGEKECLERIRGNGVSLMALNNKERKK
jgi:hypothetical protein